MLFSSSCHSDELLFGLECALFDSIISSSFTRFEQGAVLGGEPDSLIVKINFLVFKSKYFVNSIDYFNLTNINLQITGQPMTNPNLNVYPVTNRL